MSRGTNERRQARSLTTVDKGHTTDRQRPQREEEDGLYHKRIGEDGADILKYGETMKRNNVLCVASRVNIGNRLRKTDQTDSRVIIWRTGRPTPMSKSIMTARRFSEAVTVTVFIVAILYRRRLMQSEAAGIAVLSAIWIRVTVG
jgi:hypothetical protein